MESIQARQVFDRVHKLNLEEVGDYKADRIRGILRFCERNSIVYDVSELKKISRKELISIKYDVIRRLNAGETVAEFAKS